MNTVPKILALMLALILPVACSEKLLTRDDYYEPGIRLSENDVRAAIDRLPKGEAGTFITIMERTYLNLLIGNPDIDRLAAYERLIDGQVRYKLSRELKTLFYVRTPEGYYPSEHEVIWMHMLLSWGYALRGRYDDARVEMKKCSNIITLRIHEKGRFDDPLIRVIMAGLWAMCGSWEDGKVDLRAARRLAPGSSWTKSLSERQRPPAHLVVVLGGMGLEPEWKPRIEANPIRGAREVTFHRRGMRSALAVRDARNESVAMTITPDSLPWYIRHRYRDNEIQETIQDTHYIQKVIRNSLLSMRDYDDVYTIENTFDTSYQYRFVRFLPDYAWIGWSDKPLETPVTAWAAGARVQLLQRRIAPPGDGPAVTIAFYADTRLEKKEIAE